MTEAQTDKSLLGKVAFVTGGGSGIGLQIVLYFLTRGYVCYLDRYLTSSTLSLMRDRASVIAVDANKDINRNIMQATTLDEPQRESIRARLATDVVDVTDWEAQAATFTWGLDEFKKIDYVFPCAGIGEKPWLPKVSVGQTGAFVKPDLRVIDVDMKGVMYTIALAIQQFARQGFGGQSVFIFFFSFSLTNKEQ
jgi:NAD(P)-dependent dehydrogenase (short-subunit alcohol dehydrogenase family)